MEWISVDDRLPEDDETLPRYNDTHLEFVSVLACGYYYDDSEELRVSMVNRLCQKTTGIEYIDSQCAFRDVWRWSTQFHRVTHWMPLPEPPEINQMSKSADNNCKTLGRKFAAQL